MKISLCMIVKNEEKRLGDCLKNVVDFVDEIIMVDTGSSDESKRIAKLYTSKIYDFKWCDDFSAARNFSISKASNDLILVLDADEVIESFSKESVIEKFRKHDNIVARVKRINPFEDDNGIKKYIERVNRMFNKKYYLYEGIIHEQIVRKDKSEYLTEDVDIVINHEGYMDEVIADTDKINRNIKLLNKALLSCPKDPYIYYQLGKSKFKIKEYDESALYFKKAIDIEKNIKLEYMIDAIESYGYALIKSEKYEEALALEKYSEIYALKSTYNFLMGLIYMNNAAFNDAILYFKKCLKAENEDIEGISTYLPNYNIGIIYESLGKMEDAIKYFNNSSDYILSKKRIQAFEDKIGDAKEDINRCILKNDMKRALELFDQVKSYRFYDPQLYSLESVIHMIKGDYDRAKETLVAGLNLYEDCGDIIYNLAFLYENLGESENALKYYRKLLIIDKMDKETINKIKEIETIMGGSSK